MSRSYKKNPGFTDRERNGAKYPKRLANKKVRHYDKLLTSPGDYKKLFPSWDIHDYNFRYYSIKEVEDYLGESFGRKIYQTWIK